MLIISANKIKDFEKVPNKRSGLLLLHAELLSEIKFRENKTKYEQFKISIAKIYNAQRLQYNFNSHDQIKGAYEKNQQCYQ